MVDLKSKKSPLSRRSQRLIGAVGVSNLGDGMVVVAIPLLGATLTSDPKTLGMLAAAGAFPALVFTLPVGGLVDRVSRGRLVISTSFIRAVMLGFLVMAVVSGGLQLWHLFAVAILLGVAELLFDTGSAALLPSVVPKAQLARANGYIATLVELSNGVLGPAIGGLLFAVTAGLPFLATCLAFAIAGIILLTVTQNQPTRPEPTASPADDARPEDTGRSRMAQFLGEIGEGIRWLIRNAPLRPLAIAVAGSNLLGWMPEAAFVLYAKKELGLNDAGFGILFATISVGAVIGGLLSGRLVEHLGVGKVIIISLLAYGILTIPPAFLHSAIAVGVVLFIQGLPLVAWSVVSRTTLQTLVPNHLLGRVFSVFTLLGAGLAPIGLLLGGFLSGVFGLRSVFVISGIGMTIVALACARGLNRLAVEVARASEPSAPVDTPSPRDDTPAVRDTPAAP
ncbi:MAG TPA: MFS transporter [Natronosporangium sp.]|nr:MFS transporter [Natronosporangium sp.]